MKQLERIHRKLAATPLSSVLTICGLLLVVFASMCVYSESYRSAYNVTNVLVQCVPLACVSLGQTLVIISGGIDLSVGSTISVCTAIAARLMGSDNPAQVLLGVVVVFAFAAGVGLVNGAGVNYLKVPPMITTLCTSTILEGVALWILPVAGGKINADFARVIYKKWDIISMPLLILVALFLVMRYLLYRTRTGTSLYAIGRSRTIAASMGIKTTRASMKAYVLAALCAAVTGLLLASRMRVGDPTCGANYGMDSIAATVIGGTSLAGGTGLLSGTVAGAFLIGMLSNVMNNLNVNQFYQYVMKGALLIAAMVVYSISDRLEVRRRASESAVEPLEGDCLPPAAGVAGHHRGDDRRPGCSGARLPDGGADAHHLTPSVCSRHHHPGSGGGYSGGGHRPVRGCHRHDGKHLLHIGNAGQ